VLIVAVYVVLGARLPAGLKVAVRPTKLTTPATGVVPCVKVKVAVVIVEEFIASLKNARIALLMATPVAALAGVVKLT
jgi:hypothetical protein